MAKTVLISGASIAGLTMAYWMREYGYQVTVVEIGSGPRRGGSPIDVRGEALDTAQRMGILEAIKAVKLSMIVEFMTADGQVAGQRRVDELGALRPGDDTEIRRDDLVNILYDNAKTGITYRFNDRIVDIQQGKECVAVRFQDGTQQQYDFVIGADGIHSGVRQLTFGPEKQFSLFLNAYFSTFPTDTSLGKKNYGQTYTTPTHLAIVYYYNVNVADGFLIFRAAEKINYNRHDIAAQKQLVINSFQGVGWKVPQLIEALQKTDQFYFDQVCQIRMPSWTRGRVALIGDAGYAPAFPTGMGSTLAMQGATVLADAIAKEATYQAAFQRYDERFRPTVEALQATVYEGLDFLLPPTQAAIDARNKGKGPE